MGQKDITLFTCFGAKLWLAASPPDVLKGFTFQSGSLQDERLGLNGILRPSLFRNMPTGKAEPSAHQAAKPRGNRIGGRGPFSALLRHESTPIVCELPQPRGCVDNGESIPASLRRRNEALSRVNQKRM